MYSLVINIQTAQHTGGYVGKVPNVQWHYGAVFNWVLKVIHVFFGFCNTALSDWLKNPAQPYQPIRSKNKTNRASLAHVFSRFASATCICSQFWLVHWIVCVLCDWPVIILIFLWRNSIQNHTAHTVFCRTGSIIYTRIIRRHSSPSIQWLQPGLALTDGGVSSAFFVDFLICVGLPGASASHFLLTI